MAGGGRRGAGEIEDPALDELRDAYRAGNLVLLVGRGVSVAAGLPSWAQLVEHLVERARTAQVEASRLDEIADLSRRRQFIEALSAAKHALGKAEFCSVVEQRLKDRSFKPPPVARAVAALTPHLHAVLTTNLDHLLERALGGDWPMLARATDDIAQRSQFILKLHGTLLDRSTWVLTRDEYDRALYADPKLEAAFSALVRARTLLFVGYDIADDSLDPILARARVFAGDQSPRHFALVEEEAVTPYRGAALEAAGVRLIAYPNVDGKHAALTKALQGIAGRSGKRARPLSREDSPTRPGGVTAAAGADRALSPPAVSLDASLLIQTELPRILAKNAGDPIPILMRENIPRDACNGRTPLDQWTYVCEWLSRTGVPGLVFTIRIVEQVQSSSFSDEVSRWAAAFLEALLGDGGGDGGDDVRKYAANLVDCEARRWNELQRRVQIEVTNGRLSTQALAYVVARARGWSDVACFVTGSHPDNLTDALLPYIGVDDEPNETASERLSTRGRTA